MILIYSASSNLFTGSIASMSVASDSQNMSREVSVDLDAGTSGEESYHEGERTPPSLHAAARRTRKKRILVLLQCSCHLKKAIKS